MRMSRQPTKVLHVTTVLDHGGAENHLLELSRGLVGKGYAVSVAYWRGQGSLRAEFHEAGVRVIQVPVRRKFNPLNVSRFVQSVLRERPDILHTHLPLSEFYGNLAGAIARVPIIVSTKHNDDDFLRNPLARALHYVMSLPNSAIVAISDHVNAYTRHIGIAHPSRMLTIHYGLDVGGFDRQISPEALSLARIAVGGSMGPLVGTLARLERQKGLEYLLQALAEVKQLIPSVRCAIVGDGSLRSGLQQLAGDLGIAKDVLFLGKRTDVPALMKTFDLFVLPSLWEGFGLVLLEAMAASRPIVATRVSAIPEIVLDGETGRLVSPRDVPSLVRAITDMLRDPATAERMGRAGRSRVEREFSSGKMVERTHQLYADLVRRMEDRA